MTSMKMGVLVGEGPVTPGDLDCIRRSRLDSVKLRALSNPASDVDLYRDAGIESFLVHLLSPTAADRPTSAAEFTEVFLPKVEAFVQKGVYNFEVHDAPNVRERGYGVSWHNPEAFGEWFLAVKDRFRGALGPLVRIGFPGLAPPAPNPWGRAPDISDRDFLTRCGEVVRSSDFLCCHVYWRSADELRAFDGGVRFVRRYLEAFPNVPLVISNFANLSADTDDETRGDQLAEFYFTCSQYDECHYDWSWFQAHWPRMEAAYASLLRSADPAHDSIAWMGADGIRSIVDGVAARCQMPHPAAMRFVWPTEFRHYTQFYGENQRSYYQTSYANCLHAGHNGVDLQVKHDHPERSPIRACLAGVVTRKEMRSTGYGHHIYIRSEVDGVGTVTLLYAHMSHVLPEEGDRIEAGQIIGSAGSTGASTGPHLHLSLKVEGLDLPANVGYLNARPYLDPLPAPRGKPRVQYARTYVLVPPGGDARWARAIVASTWEDHRFTIGGSADDAGIGDLDVRRVVTINPDAWNGDLHAFFDTYYPGTIYVPVEVERAENLAAALADLPELPAEPPPQPEPPRGDPRTPYARTYVLLPPDAGVEWAMAVVNGGWDNHRFTIGGSADDAGIGDLDFRRVLAVNPSAWNGDLQDFFEQHYPGVRYVALDVDTPEELDQRLRAL